MDIVKASEISEDMLKYGLSQVPLVICSESPRIYKKLSSAGYEKVSLNALLAQDLLQYPQKDRRLQVQTSFNKVLSAYQSVLLEDFEMLFDPSYPIDVLKLFCEKSRTANIAVKWPGKFTVNKLIYTEPENEDYHEYNCSSYQIRVVQ